MDLRQLRYFVAVAEVLSFSRAAERLHVSQPPLSRGIAALEADLGVVLLERTRRSVRLSEAGRAFLERARALLADAEAARGAARRAALGETGRLAVGFGGAAGYTPLPALLRRYRERHPGVELALVTLPMIEQEAAITAGRVDAGLVMLPADAGPLAHRVLAEGTLIAALPAGHRLARLRTLGAADLVGEDLLSFPRAGLEGFHQALSAWFQRAAIAPRLVREAAPIESLIGLVAAGLGIAIAPSVAERLRLPGVVYRPLRGAGLRVPLALAWRRDNRSPALARFVALARESARRAG